MRFGLTANVEVPDVLNVCREVLKSLEGEEVFLEDLIAPAFGREGHTLEEIDVDILITVGGDGTILRSLQHTNTPILGINAGVLGFLTEVPRDAIRGSLERVLAGDYLIQERLRLKTMLEGIRYPDALNEAVIHTAHVAKIRQFRVSVDGHLALDVRADGIIMATPTGSTCYAMSVGAPIVDPSVDCLVIAPMAPFKFAARPFVVPADSRVRVELVKPKPCVLVVDGQEENPVEGGQSIEFTRSESPARFVNLGSNFYTKMREKLMGDR